MESVKIVPASDVGKIANDCVILDVRTPAEHAEVHLQRPHDHVPLDQLDANEFMTRRGLDRMTAVYILCRGGTRARTAADKFVHAGYDNIHVVEGGLTGCVECGEPVVRNDAVNSNAQGTQSAEAPGAATLAAKDKVYGKLGALPIEQQVRLFAGLIIGLGTLFGLMGAEIFFLLPLVGGFGLAWSGWSGWCGMAQLLAKAPWNKEKAAAAV